jgi:MFS family permease
MADEAVAQTARPLGKSLDAASFTPLHRKYWLLAALGVMLDGFDFFIIGVANPLITKGYHLDATLKGLVSAAAIIGSIFGAGLLGPLADRIGRRRIFMYDLVLFAIFSVACIFAWDVWSLFAFRLILGVAIGLDYPIAASYLAEVLPSRSRGRWLVGAFSLQAVGILLGALVGVVALELFPHIYTWRIMLGFGVVPALLIIYMRRNVPESPRWLAQNGHDAEGARVAAALCGHPVTVTEADRSRSEASAEGLGALVQPQLFKRAMLRRTIFTAVPWFLMDIATYGVGIFTPTILAAIAVAGSNTTFLSDDIASTKETAALDVFLVIGFAVAIVLVERVGRVKLQLLGFAVMAAALCLLGTAEALPGGGNKHLVFVFVAFAFFNTFMNAGPNATTYALPAEVFPTEIRAAGQGFAAASAKMGAAVGVFLFPILMDDIGTSALLFLTAGACALGFAVTYALRIEPRGRSLDEVSGRVVAQLAPRPVPP